MPGRTAVRWRRTPGCGLLFTSAKIVLPPKKNDPAESVFFIEVSFRLIAGFLRAAADADTDCPFVEGRSAGLRSVARAARERMLKKNREKVCTPAEKPLPL